MKINKDVLIRTKKMFKPSFLDNEIEILPLTVAELKGFMNIDKEDDSKTLDLMAGLLASKTSLENSPEELLEILTPSEMQEIFKAMMPNQENFTPSQNS